MMMKKKKKKRKIASLAYVSPRQLRQSSPYLLLNYQAIDSPCFANDSGTLRPLPTIQASACEVGQEVRSGKRGEETS